MVVKNLIFKREIKILKGKGVKKCDSNFGWVIIGFWVFKVLVLLKYWSVFDGLVLRVMNMVEVIRELW